mgnify:FL=1
MSGFFFWLGVAVAVVGGLFFLFFVFGFVGALLAVRRHIVLPRLALLAVRFFRGAFNALGSLLGDPHLADHAGVALINHIHRRRFLQSSSPPVLILPQCLRSVDCPARIDPRFGIVCRQCGKCVIGRLKKAYPEIRLFVTPGGTFATRIIRQERPTTVLGVACAGDLYEGMLYCHTRGVVVCGLELLRDGCVETAVDEERLFSIVDHFSRGRKEHIAEEG